MPLHEHKHLHRTRVCTIAGCVLLILGCVVPTGCKTGSKSESADAASDGGPSGGSPPMPGDDWSSFTAKDGVSFKAPSDGVLKEEKLRETYTGIDDHGLYYVSVTPCQSSVIRDARRNMLESSLERDVTDTGAAVSKTKIKLGEHSGLETQEPDGSARTKISRSFVTDSQLIDCSWLGSNQRIEVGQLFLDSLTLPEPATE